MQEFADAIQDETIEETATTAPNDALKHDTYEELLEEDLTDEVKAAKRERLETVDREIIRLEEEKKANAKVFTNKIKPLEAERDGILQALDQGTEKVRRAVYDFLVIDPASQEILLVEVRRVDTDAKVDERAATAEERRAHFDSLQGDLFSGDSNPPPADLVDPADEPRAGAEHPDTERPPAGDASDTGEGTTAEAEAEQQAASGAGKVRRIRASDVKKKKAQREAKEMAEKARTLADQNDAGNESA